MKQIYLKTLLLTLMMMVGMEAWADEVTFNSNNYIGEGISSSGSVFTMTNTYVCITDSKFYGNSNYVQSYAGGVFAITPSDGYRINKIVINYTEQSFNGYQSGGTVTSSVGKLTNTNNQYITWTGSVENTLTISHDKQIRWTSIVVTYSSTIIPVHNVTWNINGDDSEALQFSEGSEIEFPVVPSYVFGRKFMGWTKTPNYFNTTDYPDDMCMSASMGTEDITFYAVFADMQYVQSQTITWNISGVVTSASGGNNVNTALKTSSISPNSGSGKWTAVAKSSYAATSSSKAQLGSGSYKFAGTISLSDTNIPSYATITAIDLTATSTATDANPYTISATVNGKKFGEDDHISSGNANCSWSDEIVGNSIVLTTSCGYNKNILISAISVSYKDIVYSNYSTTVAPRQANIAISSARYATYYNEFAYTMPEGLVGKIMEKNGEGVVATTVFSEGETVPAETALLIKGNANTYTLVESASAADDADVTALEGNLLKGSLTALTAEQMAEASQGDNKFYKLANGENGLGWYYGSASNTMGSSFAIGANKAYLVIANGGSVKSFISLDGDEDTIKTVEENRPMTIYDLQGRKVTDTKKGLYINNGKKVVK